MSVKNFKFVSPGIFINEIDNSFRPRQREGIGPVIIGRSERGPGLEPIQVSSILDYSEIFGGTVPGGGNGGGDVYRNGNYQSPMYGTYAAKAYLANNVAPLTYVRLLGAEHPNASTAGKAGWETTDDPNAALADNGGAFGLFVFLSSSITQVAAGDTQPTIITTLGTGSLAAVWYLNEGMQVQMSGTAGGGVVGTDAIKGMGSVVNSSPTAPYDLKVALTQSGGSEEIITFNFDDSGENFIRNKFNTNPQLANDSDEFYASSALKNYWLGETFENELRDNSMVGVPTLGVILPLALKGTAASSPAHKRVPAQEGRAGWFVSQNTEGAASDYNYDAATKLFRLFGRGHGEWLHKNVKVSIEDIRVSNSKLDDYGSFSVVLRNIADNDGQVQVLERFDNCNLNPASENFIGRKIGTQYAEWDNDKRQLVYYGDYPNQSSFIYVELAEGVENGTVTATAIPFGYMSPPRYKRLDISSRTDVPASRMVNWAASLYGTGTGPLMTSYTGSVVALTSIPEAALTFPSVRVRSGSFDGGITNATQAYFGFQTTRTADSTTYDPSVVDVHNLLDTRFINSADPTSSPPTGADPYAYVFTLHDVKIDANDTYAYESGSYADGRSATSSSYKSILDAGFRQFTAPFWGGYDGLNIKLPDHFYNAGMPAASATERNSSAYYSLKRAIDTVADADVVDMNLLSVPGLTQTALTSHMITTCEERGDAMAIIDLPDVYAPFQEKYYAQRSSRRTGNVATVSNALINRRLDSSYGATFYPWVQTLDEQTGQALWIPPSVAMMGVLASSEANSQLWFAPAGFNRGGLTDGAAGIPISNVTQRLTSKNRDTLYDARINPIASFPSSGLVVFGQKTLQERSSALDRINVRRLVIYLKKQISILSTQVLFEQNVPDTWARFKSLVEPLLANTKAEFGISDYRLILDETTTTPDLIDQNVLYAKIMVKPARAIEYIAIDFVIMSTGASFDD